MNSPCQLEKPNVSPTQEQPEEEIDIAALIGYSFRLAIASASCLPAVAMVALREKWIEVHFVPLALICGAVGFVLPLFVGITQNSRDPLIGFFRAIASLVMFLMIGAILLTIGIVVLMKLAD